MSDETEDFIDEEDLIDAEALVEYADLPEEETSETDSNEGIDALETEAREITDPVKEAVIEQKGGKAEDWKVEDLKLEYSGKGEFIFDGKNVINPTTGELYADGSDPEAVLMQQEMAEQWNGGGAGVFFLPDYTERTDEGEIVYVTQLELDEKGGVSYQIFSHETKYHQEEDGGNATEAYAEAHAALQWEMTEDSSETTTIDDLVLASMSAENARESAMDGSHPVETSDTRATDGTMSAEATEDIEAATASPDPWLAEILRGDPLEILLPDRDDRNVPDARTEALDHPRAANAGVPAEIRLERPDASVAVSNGDARAPASAERLIEVAGVGVKTAGDQKQVVDNQPGAREIVAPYIHERIENEDNTYGAEKTEPDIAQTISAERNGLGLRDPLPEMPAAAQKGNGVRENMQAAWLAEIFKGDPLEIPLPDREDRTVTETRAETLSQRDVSKVHAPAEIRVERPEVSPAFENENIQTAVPAEQLIGMERVGDEMKASTIPETARSTGNVIEFVQRGRVQNESENRKSSDRAIPENKQQAPLNEASVIMGRFGAPASVTRAIPSREHAQREGLPRMFSRPLPQRRLGGGTRRSASRVSELNGIRMKMAA